MVSEAVTAAGVVEQRRALAVLGVAQVVGGLGVGASISVGALLAEDLSGSAAWSGTPATLTTLGAAGFAVPLARYAERSGRRPALTAGWLVAAAGAALAVAAAVASSFAVYLVALLLMGAGNAANLQSRFAATDLAPAASRGRSLALVVWATTVGAVAGPNLTTPGAVVADRLGIPVLAGPFVFTVLAGLVASAALTVALRPDPLLRARELQGYVRPDTVEAVPRAWSVIRRSPVTSSALLCIVTGHAVMVAVMAMTPVHLHGHGAGLSLIGLTLSLHIAGMFAFSPIVGWLTDRAGRAVVVRAGLGTLLLATLTTAAAARSNAGVTVGLVLLGLGWSLTTIAASTQLAESVGTVERPRVQGTSDLVMNLAGAAAGAVAGLLVATIGYGGLSVVAALALIPAALTQARPGPPVAARGPA